MNIRTPASRIPHPARHGARRAGAWDVLCSMSHGGGFRKQNGSVLIIVLWVAVGLVSIALYFANSMTYELRASDNRVNGLAADQAIEGAARYVGTILQTYATNGMVPNNSQFACAGVPIGGAHFWLIGRDPDASSSTIPPTDPYFGMVDEASKLNLNHVTTNALYYLPMPNMTVDFAQYIEDWCNTNGAEDDMLVYSSLGYYPKSAPFETVDELRLVYGASMDLLYGDDLNLNGVLDANEKSSTGSSQMNPGLLDYTTVWSREPNFFFYNGAVSNKLNLNDMNSDSEQLPELLQGANISTSASVIYALTNGAPAITNLLQVAVNCYSVINSADFAKIYDYITTADPTNTPYFYGRVNVNTASGDVLLALFEGLGVDQNSASGAVQTLLSYRKQNPSNLDTLMWLVDALGTTSPIITALEQGDYVTTRSYQFTADIAAVGAYGRGYRRVKFVFDTTDGTPIIIYRQDLSGLGWALGDKVRQDLLANNKTTQ
jgi:type II secretory pathway component PulK